ncbi:M16 family metallopeptidase [Maribacter arenosus]|uniref:Insulinase family protein n=1 Tax=Maribacter arenosus TaxID=1854708 RepID=A0ABR7VF33_9FLAO|nr:pitrilysin family protein [Maribacter arenosus]MBD0851475.1 insulinase family protein [Maribacter arenosus]
MNKILITLILGFVALNLQAQIDRSKMPEAGPTPEINLNDPQRFELNNGLKVLVVENHKLPRVSIQLLIDNPPILEGDKAGVSSFTASLLGNGSKSIPKDDFNEEVDFLGARISFGSQSAFASSLSKYFPRILELMADAAINPNFIEEEFEKEKQKLLTALKAEEKDVSAIANRVQNALVYGTDHPYGEFITEESVNNVTLFDVIQFYEDYFVPANAYLVVIGDVRFDNVKTLVTKNFMPWTKAVPPSFQFSKPLNAQYTQINFIDVPNAVQSEIAVESLVDLKMKEEDYLPSIMANFILGGGSVSRLEQNIREDKAYAYYSRSRLSDDKYGFATFKAYTGVRNSVTDSSVVEILKEMDKIIKEPVSNEELINAKATYVGNFVMALEQPSTIARYALNIETESLPKDFYKTYLEKIEAISVADIQKAAQKYFSTNNARIVVTGKGSDVLNNLEQLTFNGKKVPIKYYDKYANEIDKPDNSVTIPEGMTAHDVLEKYIEAIGGKEKLSEVTSYAIKAEADMQGTKLNLEIMKTSKNQFMKEIKYMGNSISKEVVDGDKGYTIQQNRHKDMGEELLKDLKEESAPFAELNLLKTSMEVEGIEVINGKKAYKLKLSDVKSTFYDIETALKVRDVMSVNVDGKIMVMTMDYDDYKEVAGIKFPFSITESMGPQKWNFIIQEIKVNEGVSDVDFE